MVKVCKTFSTKDCPSNFCQLNYLEEPAKAPGICTHTSKNRGIKYRVEACKDLSEQPCSYNTDCHWNFDEPPNKTAGKCTHLP